MITFFSFVLLMICQTNSFAQETPVKEKPVKEKPVQEAPAKQIPAKEKPAKPTPEKQSPAKDAPAKDTATKPAKEDPVKETPAKEAPVKEAPEEEAPDFDNTIVFDKAEGSPPAKIQDVAWISGSWAGAAFGGTFEEVWSEPFGNSMMGMFKLVVRGRTQFYELITIAEEKGTLILRLKHFESDLKGWEEKDETINFPLVKIYDDVVFFDQYTFEKISENEMAVYVVIDGKDGKPEEVMFKFQRQE